MLISFALVGIKPTDAYIYSIIKCFNFWMAFDPISNTINFSDSDTIKTKITEYRTDTESILFSHQCMLNLCCTKWTKKPRVAHLLLPVEEEWKKHIENFNANAAKLFSSPYTLLWYVSVLRNRAFLVRCLFLNVHAAPCTGLFQDGISIEWKWSYSIEKITQKSLHFLLLIWCNSHFSFS